MRRGTVAAGAWLVACSCALARVGGGGGYSGGGGDSGGDGGAAIVFELARLILWLIFRHPMIGIPLAVVIVIVVVRLRRSGALRGTIGERPTVYPAPVTEPAGGRDGVAPRGRVNLTPVRASDPYFSEPLFLDFAQLVYTRAHEARGTGKRELLEPWMSPDAIERLFADRTNLESVSEVTLGASRLVQAATESGFVRIDVAFESNVTETRAGARGQLLCRERWSFRRKAGVRSPGPARMRTLGCVGCGSTAEPAPDGACPHCGAARRGGLSQWEVASIPEATRRPLTAPELEVIEGDDVERGTTRPTVMDPRLSAARRAFEGRHPDHDWTAFERHVRTAFLAMQEAWSSGEWDRARRFETDALFQAHRFWMQRYAAFGLVNRVEQVEVQRVVVARIDSDAYYDSITVRVFARALDWTRDRDGKTVGGSATRPTSFSEYWTLLRAVPGTTGRPASCPSCAAPLPPGEGSTVCAHCGAQLVGDAEDWVVSRIEQDDAY